MKCDVVEENENQKVHLKINRKNRTYISKTKSVYSEDFIDYPPKIRQRQ